MSFSRPSALLFGLSKGTDESGHLAWAPSSARSKLWLASGTRRSNLAARWATAGAAKLVPLALKGVSYRPLSASAMLRRNLWVYGLGGLLVPFIGIKIIDMLLTAVGLV